MMPQPRDDVDPTPWPAALICGVVGGLAALAAFPPYGMWMLLPVSLALLSAALLTRSVWVAALASLAWGAAFFVPLTAWANTYAGTAPWIALGVFEALFIVLFGLLARLVLVRRGLCPTSALVVSALWVGVETLRSHAPWGGLPWGASAFALGDSPLLNLGPWIGMAGLSFVVAFLGQMILHGALSLLGRRHRGLTGFAGVWPFALAVAAILATVVVPHPVNRAPVDRPTMTVAGIQGSMDRIDPATMVMPDDVFENHLATTRTLIESTSLEGRQLDLIVWPEDSTGYDPRQDPWMADQLTAAAADAGAPVLIGTQAAVGESERLNQSVLYTSDGST
ncbi:MAG: apolipoprotein N-acyltransferase, partial [Brachybacterium tyrofermentans]